MTSWSNQSKNSFSTSDQSKNSTSFTNQSKNIVLLWSTLNFPWLLSLPWQVESSGAIYTNRSKN